MSNIRHQDLPLSSAEITAAYNTRSVTARQIFSQANSRAATPHSTSRSGTMSPSNLESVNQRLFTPITSTSVVLAPSVQQRSSSPDLGIFRGQVFEVNIDFHSVELVRLNGSQRTPQR
jgi:hypothetical protein